ncbi:MAG: glycosyltransferase involved in cell wall biosynthesis [Verrucomicrobiales bacterium]|jgi:glycosyltransferase involved in cell wall biosynthesis
MKIAFFSAYPGFAGSQKMALQLAVAARDAGLEAVAVAPGDWEYLQRAKQEGVESAVLPAPKGLLKFGKSAIQGSIFKKLSLVAFQLLPYNLKAARFFRKHGIDLVYAAQERAVIEIGLGAKLARKPVLWHVQMGPVSNLNRIYKMCRKLATRMICVSNAVAGGLNEALGRESAPETSVIYNGIPDLPGGAPEYPLAAAGGALKILFLGNIVPGKGPHHLIEAVGKLSASGASVQLKIGGQSRDEPFMEYLKSLRSGLDLEKSVEFIGFRDDIPELIEESDIVVCPSVESERIENEFGVWNVDSKEGFCLVALEAMRARRPVIASDSYGLKEVVAHGETGLRVPPGDAGALFGALEQLAADHALREKFGEAGRRRFEERFSLRNMTEKFVSAFNDMVPQKQPSTNSAPS